MTMTLKVLGQLAPVANTLTKLYTVPAATQTVVSSLVIAENLNSNSSFRVSIRVAGAADDIKQYIYRDTTINAKTTLSATLGLTLGATDEIWVSSVSGKVSFSAFGQEKS